MTTDEVSAATSDEGTTRRFGGRRREFTLRERREMGLTVGNLADHYRELRNEGVIDEDSSRAEVSAALSARLDERNPQPFKGFGAVDWDSLISFIERLIPLILKLLELFNPPKPA